MRDFIYNLRRFFLHSRRRHRPGVHHFWLNFRKDPIFRVTVIVGFLIAVAAVTFILLATVFPDNPIKALFKKDDVMAEVNYEDGDSDDLSATATPSTEATATPTSTPSEPTATPVETQEAKTTITGWITAESGLVVRTGPSTQSTKLGTLAYGAKIEIIEEGSWLFIEYEGGGGYVHSNYVYIGDSPPGVETKNTTTSQTWTYSMNSTNILVEKIFYDGVTYYVADIETDVSNIQTAYDSQSNQLPSELLEGTDAVLAINGDYFGFSDDGIVVRNGELIRDLFFSEIAVLYDTGELSVYHYTEITAQDIIDAGALQCWSCGPILVEDYIAVTDFSDSDLQEANPRTGIGMIEPGHYIWVVADGRQEESTGFTLEEFAEVFQEYRCENAYNLDGGGTSIMFFEGEIITSPSGGEERATSDVIYIK